MRALLVLGGLLGVLVVGCRSPSGPTALDLEQATVRTESIEEGTARLEDGVFRQPLTPDGATEAVIQLGKWTAGDLDGQAGGDVALITIEDTGGGGSGAFFFLHSPH